MTKRTPVAVALTLLILLAVTMLLRNPVPLDARGTTSGQRPNPAVPHQDAPALAVLALSIQGQPTLVGPTAPVPVALPTPLPVTIPTPMTVSDGGQIITATGDYTFIFANAVNLPRVPQPVDSMAVRVLQINGKWVTAEYRVAQETVRMVFNTQALLGYWTR